MKTAKILNSIIVVLFFASLGVGLFFLYLDYEFPKVHATGTHPTVPDEYSDCITCHAEVTAQVTQDWHESKHGITLVKCVVCHGDPTGEGSITFTATPDPIDICARCHDPSIQRMIEKFGEGLDCNSCHPYHQNPAHGPAYETKERATKTTL